ncbi:MAG: rhodanese-like domain-containing protein [Candidatus Marinimicrobia bacterium]|nr:rhodanese-like domain-containing protein [Candidatus Neomarinimicrobiota bacterium]MCF7828817.1 rhodanese-like domain-containing protein [Candidatus Neomarinimicrobiota bacterium]MCF7880734.1 rhodanese-like domain-containing protein [Candidatus Neomarinimicrobiota bacterium]
MEYFWIGLGVLIVVWFIWRKWQMRNLDITPAELDDHLNKVPRPMLLDVRTQSEYNSGHLSNAKNVPAQQLRHKLDQLEKNKRKEIVVYCQTGSRSGSVARLLSRLDFNVKHLKGGLVAYNRYKNS